MLLNPATTASGDNQYVIGVQHRNQWLGSGTMFSTSTAMGEVSIGQKRGRRKAFVGLGLVLNTDVGGESKMRLNTGGVTAAGYVPFKNGHWLSAGMQLAFNNRSADLSRLVFYNQWDGSSLNSSLPSGENNLNVSYGYLDAGAGLNYRFKPSRNVNVKRQSNEFNFGIALHHINQPKLRYDALTEDKLYRKLTINAMYRFGISNASAFQINAIQFFQGKHTETTIGMLYIWRMHEASLITTFSEEQNIYFGAFMRFNGGAFTPYLGADLGPFRLGISNDFNIGKVGNISRFSLELSLAYTFDKQAGFLRR